MFVHRHAVGGVVGDADQLDLRIGQELALVVDRQRHADHAGKAQALAVGDGARLRLDQQRAVLVDAPGRHLVDDLGIARREPDEIAVADHQRAGAEPPRQRRMLGQMQRLAVHRNDGARLDPADHVLELRLARMAGHMHQMRAVGDDLDALVDQPVDDACRSPSRCREWAATRRSRGRPSTAPPRDARPGRCARAPRAARPGCRCRAPPPCPAADGHRRPCRETAARRRDSRSRARPR